MPFTLSDDEQLIQRTMREFAQDRVGLAKASDNDRFDRFPEAELAEAAQLGLLALGDPSRPGATAYALAVDELAQVDPNLAAALVAHTAATMAANAAGATGLAAQLAGGELGAVLMTEEATGSDHEHPGTTATPDGKGGHRITGQKVWALNAAAARHFLVQAMLDGQPAFFAIARDAPGVRVGENEPLLGLRAAGIRTVYLSDVPAPAVCRLGGPGEAAAARAAARAAFQVGAAAALCGCVAGALEAAARFAETRKQFGEPIGSYQAVSDGLADIDTKLAAARALTLQAAARVGQPDGPVMAARAKAFAAEMAIPMTRQAIRVQGGTGFMRHGGTERFARDARALQFVGETTQMQRDLLKRNLLPGIEFPATP